MVEEEQGFVLTCRHDIPINVVEMNAANKDSDFNLIKSYFSSPPKQIVITTTSGSVGW